MSKFTSWEFAIQSTEQSYETGTVTIDPIVASRSGALEDQDIRDMIEKDSNRNYGRTRAVVHSHLRNSRHPRRTSSQDRDGDTLTIVIDGQQEKIRLSDIDTPERKQPYGTRAKQALSELAFGKTITVLTTTKDRYGRVIGHITADGVDVNAELVRLGYAWVYRRYSNDKELIHLEENARSGGLGLWADSNPIPPWEWRRGRRS